MAGVGGARGAGTTLIFLYGPPASGKLTVARALAKHTGYRVFHNHLTIDLVSAIFDWGSRPFWRFVDRYRMELLGAAAEAGVPGVIFTFVYAKGADDRFVGRIRKTVERHGGRVLFVRLTCTRRELLRRVGSPSRRAYRKMTKVAWLHALLKRYELFADVPYPGTLVVDTTRLRPGQAARRIAEHFRLPVVRPGGAHRRRPASA